VRIFVMGRNVWRDEDAWPLPRAAPTRLHLRAGGRLAWEPPAAGEERDAYVFDPLDPVPTTGGQTYLPGVWITKYAGPHDERDAEARPDVLVYTTAPLDRDLEVTGPVTATLHVATEGRDTDFTVKLVDVHPDGRALGVVDGILRARYRDGLDRPSLLEPGRVYELKVDLTATSHVFLAGHAIRVDVSSSNFPRFDRNPNTGAEPAQARRDEFVAVRQSVFHDAERPSFVTLPVVP
jgi:putative CocE/NonD family hydrolase